MKNFIDKLKKALRQSCTDAFYFSDDETSLIGAEYLLTVNTAKSIQELNVCFGTPYKIFLEHSTATFSTLSPPLLNSSSANNFLGYSGITRTGERDTTRSGKIDIAVYKNDDMGDTALCAIEFKGFNPPKKKIIEDLERNLEYFTFRANTGQSTVSFSLFSALHGYTKTFTDNKESSNLNKVKLRYINYINSLTLPLGVTSNVEVFTVRRGIMPDPNDSHTQLMGLEGNEDYHFMGAIVSFFR